MEITTFALEDSQWSGREAIAEGPQSFRQLSTFNGS